MSFIVPKEGYPVIPDKTKMLERVTITLASESNLLHQIWRWIWLLSNSIRIKDSSEQNQRKQPKTSVRVISTSNNLEKDYLLIIFIKDHAEKMIIFCLTKTCHNYYATFFENENLFLNCRRKVGDIARVFSFWFLISSHKENILCKGEIVN